jgi:hypothetical protein
VFLVPQSDGLCSVGQVLKLTPGARSSLLSNLKLRSRLGVSHLGNIPRSIRSRLNHLSN